MGKEIHNAHPRSKYLRTPNVTSRTIEVARVGPGSAFGFTGDVLTVAVSSASASFYVVPAEHIPQLPSAVLQALCSLPGVPTTGGATQPAAGGPANRTLVPQLAQLPRGDPDVWHGSPFVTGKLRPSGHLRLMAKQYGTWTRKEELAAVDRTFLEGVQVQCGGDPTKVDQPNLKTLRLKIRAKLGKDPMYEPNDVAKTRLASLEDRIEPKLQAKGSIEPLPPSRLVSNVSPLVKRVEQQMAKHTRVEGPNFGPISIADAEKYAQRRRSLEMRKAAQPHGSDEQSWAHYTDDSGDPFSP